MSRISFPLPMMMVTNLLMTMVMMMMMMMPWLCFSLSFLATRQGRSFMAAASASVFHCPM